MSDPGQTHFVGDDCLPDGHREERVERAEDGVTYERNVRDEMARILAERSREREAEPRCKRVDSLGKVCGDERESWRHNLRGLPFLSDRHAYEPEMNP